MARRKEKNERNAFFVVRGSGRKRRRVATAHRVCTKRLLSSFRAYRETKSSDLCQSVGDSRAPRIPRSRVHPHSNRPRYLSFFLSFFFSLLLFHNRAAFPRTCTWVFAPRVLETCAHNTFPRILPIVQYLCTSSILGLRTWLWVSEASLIAYNFTRSEDYYY